MKREYKIFSAFDVPDHEAYDFSDDNCPVVQYFRDESEINNIVRLWSNGAVPPPSRIPPRYVDCTQIEDFQHALDVLCDAEEMLDSMTPAQRSRFQDDPVSFIEYFSDPEHHKEFESLNFSLSEPKVDSGTVNKGSSPSEPLSSEDKK